MPKPLKAMLAALAVLAFAATPAHALADTPKDAKKAPAAQAAAPMDINTASEAELATLKGIGPVRARAIVKGRPYARKDELVQRGIIPQGVYDDIRERIIARQK